MQCVRKTRLESKTNLDYNQIFTRQLKEMMAFSYKYTIKGSEVYSLKKYTLKKDGIFTIRLRIS